MSNNSGTTWKHTYWQLISSSLIDFPRQLIDFRLPTNLHVLTYLCCGQCNAFAGHEWIDIPVFKDSSNIWVGTTPAARDLGASTRPELTPADRRLLDSLSCPRLSDPWWLFAYGIGRARAPSPSRPGSPAALSAASRGPVGRDGPFPPPHTHTPTQSSSWFVPASRIHGAQRRAPSLLLLTLSHLYAAPEDLAYLARPGCLRLK
ncbi:hypothetical protein B0H14DRAFT_3642010 [Mycena olivaceomarginata]|nr:hypothetical protein B0H14DRAFT_3642010 [Mycena olivaceomarginata]